MYENIYVYIEVSAFVLIHSCILSFSPALFYCVLFVRVHSGHSSSFFFFFFLISHCHVKVDSHIGSILY